MCGSHMMAQPIGNTYKQDNRWILFSKINACSKFIHAYNKKFEARSVGWTETQIEIQIEIQTDTTHSHLHAQTQHTVTCTHTHTHTNLEHLPTQPMHQTVLHSSGLSSGYYYMNNIVLHFWRTAQLSLGTVVAVQLQLHRVKPSSILSLMNVPQFNSTERLI